MQSSLFFFVRGIDVFCFFDGLVLTFKPACVIIFLKEDTKWNGVAKV
jgi:hypothetical protein